jgi:para-aminobenzoate synthetase component 2
MQIGFIDHYDSFSHNLIDWLHSLDPALTVLYARWDQPIEMAAIRAADIPIVVSPGPGAPTAVGPTLELVKESIGKRPILGVCLGHQILGVVLKLKVTRVNRAIHGTTVVVQKSPQFSKILSAMPETFRVAVYNSLCLDVAEDSGRRDFSGEPGWIVTARSQDGQVMGIEACCDPIASGVQFHPESFLSEQARPMGLAWLEECRRWMESRNS